MKSKKMADAVNAAALLAIAEMVPKNAWLDCSGYINRVHIFQHVTGRVLPNTTIVPPPLLIKHCLIM